MDKPPPVPDPVPPAEADRRPGYLASLGAWFGRLPTIAKAAVAAFPFSVMILLGGTAVWRDQTRRQVSVEVSSEADRTLLAAGLDLDLRQALIDTLNERLQGVEAVAATRGLVQAMDTDPEDAVSFKAFGSALSTDQVTAIVRYILGSPRPTQVRFDLLCGGRECGDGHGLTDAMRLVVFVQTRSGVQRTSYPLAPGGGLGHGVRAAVNRTADTLLEQTEPLLAGIYDINAASSALFDDEVQRDIGTAGKVAAALRGGKPGEACVAEVVTAGALMMRGQLEDGIGALLSAGRTHDAACRLRIASQAAVLLAFAAGCAPDPTAREAAFGQLSVLVGRMPAIAKGAPGFLADRVPGSRMFLASAGLLRDVDDGTRGAICSRTANSASGRSAGLARGMTSLLAQMRRELPPDTSPMYERQVIDMLKLVSDDGVHGEDLASRYEITHGLLGLARDYAVSASQPRHFLMLQGELAMDGVRLARDALALPQAQKEQALVGIGIDATAAADADGILLGSVRANLGVARSAFAAAASARNASRLEEPSPDIEPLVLLGDALAAGGDTAGARRAYAEGIDAFIADGEPIDQLGQLAQAASHWAVLRVADGGCRAGARPDDQWEARWSKLGAGGRDACSLLQAEPPSGRSLLDVVRPLAADVVVNCRLDAHAQSEDPLVSWTARMVLADCERAHGVGDKQLLRAFARQDSAAVEADVANALKNGR